VPAGRGILATPTESLVEVVLRARPIVLLAIVSPLLAAACARPPPPPPPPAPPAAEAPAPARLGTIVAIRRLAASPSSAVEFVVREDDGATVVVLQPNTEGLGVGERVAFHEGARTRIARAP
jgi:hypothetical protein